MNKLKSLAENNFYFSSESVTEGHSDKLCDLISDTILDAYLTQDPESKVSCVTIAKSNMVYTNKLINYKKAY